MVLWAVWAVLWAAVLREAPRMHTPLDEMWLHGVLAVTTVVLVLLTALGVGGS